MSVHRGAEPLAHLHWRKSSYSAGDGGECVEVAYSAASVHVRDSKDRDGARLTVGRNQWTEFVRTVARETSTARSAT